MTDPDQPTSITAAEVSAHAEHVRERIRSAGGDPSRIRLVAVTKAFGVDVVRAALRAGLSDVAENYAQELIDKVAGLEASELAQARFHFVGRLQRNKVKALAPLVHLWQTVDRPELGNEIAKRAPGAAVLVQVNASGEAQKGGCSPSETGPLVEQLRQSGLDVRGLMAVGVAGEDDATARAFDALSTLADGLDLTERSMGMTADLEIAVRSGATMVRIGRELFGSRPPR